MNRLRKLKELVFAIISDGIWIAVEPEIKEVVRKMQIHTLERVKLSAVEGQIPEDVVDSMIQELTPPAPPP